MTKNNWVLIDLDGSLLTWNPNTNQMENTGVKTDAKFAGYCFKDNVSKDEYSGNSNNYNNFDDLNGPNVPYQGMCLH